jgi:hypothetical protein
MSILDKALAMQREQESFIGGGAKVNAEQSKVKGANKKRQYIDTNEDDDEFESVSSAYSATSERDLDSKGRDKIFASKSHSFEAVKATKEELDRYGMKKGMTSDDIALIRSRLE